jgi:single-strand DNA-binding protein
MNLVVVMGNLTRDPELRNTQSGKAVLTGGIAVKSGTDDVVFLEFKIWEKRAEAYAKFHKKGGKSLLQGRLATEKWKDKDGNERSKTVLVVTNWEFAGAAKEEECF